MLWDGLILLLLVALAVAGWNIGIINSWRGPVAMIVATIATQQLYVDFSAWIVQQLQLSPEQGVALGYLLLWCGIEIVAELALTLLVPLGTKNRPMFFGRATGAALGLVKGLVIVLLPMIALNAPIKISGPPDATKGALFNPMELGLDKAVSLPFFGGIAKGMYPVLGPIVTSSKEPGFKLNFKRGSQQDSSGKDVETP